MPAGRTAVVLGGLDALGFAIAERLHAGGADVSVVASDAAASRYGQDLERLGVPLTRGSAASRAALVAAGIRSADVLVLSTDDDAENVDAALAAIELRPGLRLVIRLFDPSLGTYLRETLEHAAVLSMSSVAAPVFAGMALRALDQVPARAAARSVRRRARGPRVGVDRVLAGVLGALAMLIVVATVYFSVALGLRPLDALYFVCTTITTVGYGDIAVRDAPDAAKIVAMLLMLGGAAFVAVLYALFADRIVARRLEVLQGRVAVRARGHAIVVGAGNIGLLVAPRLAERVPRVVVIERDGMNRNVTALRAAGHHVIVADATVDETLDLARVETASVVLALTDSDTTNVHVALAVRRRSADVPVVARVVSPGVSAHLSERGYAAAASSVGIASEAFARAALETVPRA